MRTTAEHWIRHLQLSPHVEGGAFRQTYRASQVLQKDALPSEFSGDRHASTHIYFLLEQGQYSAFHRILSDEVWHFYFGDPLLVHEIREDGTRLTHTLGPPYENATPFHAVIQAKSWFASEVAPSGEYALVGCTVAPGFDFADFQLAKRDELARAFPEHAELIARLTRS